MIDSADTTIVTSDLENIEKLMSEDCKTAIFTHHHINLVYMQSSDIRELFQQFCLSCSVMSVWEQGRGLFNSITQQQIDFLIG